MSVENMLKNLSDESSDSFFEDLKNSTSIKSFKTTALLELDSKPKRKVKFDEHDEIFDYKESSIAFADADSLLQNNVNLQSISMVSENQESLEKITQNAKRYEDVLLKSQEYQKNICDEQEKLLEGFLKQQNENQKLINDNIKKQQQKISNCLQSMKASSNFLSCNDSHCQAFVDKLNKLHDEEVTLIDISYNNQIHVLKQFIESHKDLFETEIEQLKKHYETEIKCKQDDYLRNLSSIKHDYEQLVLNIKECKSFDSVEKCLQKLNTICPDLEKTRTNLVQSLSHFENTNKEFNVMYQNFAQCTKQQIEDIQKSNKKQSEAVISIDLFLRNSFQEFHSENTYLKNAMENINTKLQKLDLEREHYIKGIDYERSFIEKLWDKLHKEENIFKQKMSDEWTLLENEKVRLETLKKIGFTNFDIEKKSKESEISIKTAQEELQKLLLEKDRMNAISIEIEQEQKKLQDQSKKLEIDQMKIKEKENKVENDFRKLQELEKRYQNLVMENNRNLQLISKENEDLKNRHLLLSKEKLGMYDIFKEYKTNVISSCSDEIPVQDDLSSRNQEQNRQINWDVYKLKMRLDN